MEQQDIKEADESVAHSSDIKEKLRSGTYRLIEKRGRSEVWQFFCKIKNENGDALVDLVACNTCYSILKFTGSTSNLVKHKCYIASASKFRNAAPPIEVNEATKDEGISLVTEWVLKNCRPLKIIDDSGIKKFASFLINVGATYGANVDIDRLLPDPKTVSRNISEIYSSHYGPIQTEIQQCKAFGYAITSDIWTDDYLKASYLSCTIHYVRDGVLVDRLMAMKSMKGSPCTGENMRTKIQSILRDFGCDLELDKPVIVTDPGSHMIKAFSEAEKIHCVNHLLNNAVEKAIVAVPEMENIITICSKLVKYFKKSDINSTLGVSASPTRWNTAYYLLKSIELNWIEITEYLNEQNQTYRIEGINVKHLASIVRLLEVFENVSKKLEAIERPTIHLILPNLNKLKKICKIEFNDTDIIKSLKFELNNQLLCTVTPNLTKYHNVALFLFPPTNKLIQFTPTERNIVINDCKDIMNHFLQDSGHLSEIQTQNVDDEFAEYLEDHKVDTVHNKIEQELAGYSNINVPYTIDFDALAWWNMNKQFFPLLHKASCKIFCIPASSAASERTFSNARNLITEKRCLIATNPENINKIMFLHSNLI